MLKRASTTFARISERVPRPSVSDLDQGKREFETGRWSKAYRLFQTVLRDHGREARTLEVQMLMAHCLAKMGEPEEAEVHLLEAKEELSQRDQALLAVFEAAWKELEDTRRLTPAELKRRRELARGEN